MGLLMMLKLNWLQLNLKKGHAVSLQALKTINRKMMALKSNNFHQISFKNMKT
jgi:hypothetical protein